MGVCKHCKVNVSASSVSMPPSDTGANCDEIACRLWKMEAMRSIEFPVCRLTGDRS